MHATWADWRSGFVLGLCLLVGLAFSVSAHELYLDFNHDDNFFSVQHISFEESDILKGVLDVGKTPLAADSSLFIAIDLECCEQSGSPDFGQFGVSIDFGSLEIDPTLVSSFDWILPVDSCSDPILHLVFGSGIATLPQASRHELFRFMVTRQRLPSCPAVGGSLTASVTFPGGGGTSERRVYIGSDAPVIDTFPFSGDRLSGWQISEVDVYDEEPPFPGGNQVEALKGSNFNATWTDTFDYPNSADPSGNGLGACTIETPNGHGITANPDYEWWFLLARSPIVSEFQPWAHATGLTLRMYNDMSPGSVARNMRVRVRNESTGFDEFYLASASAVSMIPGEWVTVDFDWRSLSGFPANFTVLDFRVLIWGRMNQSYIGGVVIDDVVPHLATGACCAGDGSCVVVTEPSCGGTYQGDNTSCTPNPCPQPPATGACCAVNGSCTVVTEASCGGTYQGDNTSCTPNPCPQPPATGACCANNGSCTVVTQAGCSGTYQGDNTDCSPNPCPQPPATGACCAVDGSCTVVTQAACAGTYRGDNTSCTPNPCPQPPATGACCAVEGTCTVVTQAACGGAYQGDNTSCTPNPCPQPPATGACCAVEGTCTVVTQAACGGAYQGDNTTCTPNPCPQPPATGACCAIDGSCTVVTDASCSGTYQGDNTTCTPNPCPQLPATGACCAVDGSCTVVTDASCSGTYQGDNTTCTPNPCPQPPATGACCAIDGTCTLVTQAACAGTYQGDNTTCTPNPCPQPPATGACCAIDGSCTVVTEASCSGTYQGDNTTCTPNPCPQPPATGACCAIDGSCTVVTEASCGGTYQGDNTTCSPNPCPQPPATGACCAIDGSCTVVTEASCSGTYQGDNSSCTPNPCLQPPATGACCAIEGSCTEVTQASCGGTYEGDDTTCSPNPCPQPPATGACCAIDGSCTEVTQASCGGTYEGDDTTCSPNPCPQPPATGACCAIDGSCTVVTQAACGGTYEGDDTSCTPNPCPQPPATGACCAIDGSCTVVTQAACTGTYEGDNTSCAPNPCPLPLGACCLADGSCLIDTEDACAGRRGMSWSFGGGCVPNACVRAVQDVEVGRTADDFEWRVRTAESITAIGGSYRLGGEENFRPILSFTQSGDAWVAEFAAQDHTVRGIEYFFGMVTRANVEIEYGTALAPHRLTLRGIVDVPAVTPLTLRMIAAPLLADDRGNLLDRLTTLFGASGPSSWRMGRWDPVSASYRMIDAANPAGFLPGAAYWIGFGAAQPVWQLDGVTNFPPEENSTAFELQLEPGWNMLGNPAAYAISLRPQDLEIRDGAVTHSFSDAAALGLISANVYIYDPNLPDTAPFYPYDLAPARLEMWDGFWMRNLTARGLQFRVPARRALPGSARSAGSPADDWSLPLRIGSGAEHAGVALGLAAEAHDGLDRWDAFSPPRVPGAALRASFLIDADGGASPERLLRDTRSARQSLNHWQLEVTHAEAPILVRWDLPSPIDGEKGPLRLVIEMNGGARRWDMGTTRSLELPPGSHLLDIRLERTLDEIPVEREATAWAEPNPFGGGTVLRYQLAGLQNVELVILDAAGKRVWSREQTARPTGDHAVVWDGLDSGGESLPAGTYFLRVRGAADAAGRVGGSQTVKLIKLR